MGDSSVGMRRFLHAPLAREHAVQLYAHSAELAEPVAAYLAAGFDRSEPGLVVATPRHAALFAEELAQLGWDEARLEASSLLEERDAEATLAAFQVGGRISASRFEDVVGGLLDGIGRRFPGRHIRVYGEMVDVLCARGDRDAAAELEELWTRLLERRRRRFSLLCAYEVDVFDPAPQLSLLPQVCGAHTHVHPGVDPQGLGEAVRASLEDELGDAAAAVWAGLPAGIGRSGEVPVGEQALMWVSVNMPSRAERILASARQRYRGEAATVSSG